MNFNVKRFKSFGGGCDLCIKDNCNDTATTHSDTTDYVSQYSYDYGSFEGPLPRPQSKITIYNFDM